MTAPYSHPVTSHGSSQHVMLEQLARRGVRDPRVLGAMAAVPRVLFVPPALVEQAYADRALPLALGQTLSPPYVVAVMTEALHLAPHDRVLEIGTGSGYSAAVLSELPRTSTPSSGSPRSRPARPSGWRPSATGRSACTAAMARWAGRRVPPTTRSS